MFSSSSGNLSYHLYSKAKYRRRGKKTPDIMQSLSGTALYFNRILSLSKEKWFFPGRTWLCRAELFKQSETTSCGEWGPCYPIVHLKCKAAERKGLETAREVATRSFFPQEILEFSWSTQSDISQEQPWLLEFPVFSCTLTRFWGAFMGTDKGELVSFQKLVRKSVLEFRPDFLQFSAWLLFSSRHLSPCDQ